jgi:hypothetical protein
MLLEQRVIVEARYNTIIGIFTILIYSIKKSYFQLERVVNNYSPISIKNLRFEDFELTFTSLC